MKTKNKAAQELNRLRNKKLSPKRRSEIAKYAVSVREAKRKLLTANLAEDKEGSIIKK